MTVEKRAGVHVSSLCCCCLNVTKILICRQMLLKFSTIIFHVDPFSGSQDSTTLLATRHCEDKSRNFLQRPKSNLLKTL
jgi:hypothetical protein